MKNKARARFLSYRFAPYLRKLRVGATRSSAPPFRLKRPPPSHMIRPLITGFWSVSAYCDESALTGNMVVVSPLSTSSSDMHSNREGIYSPCVERWTWRSIIPAIRPSSFWRSMVGISRGMHRGHKRRLTDGDHSKLFVSFERCTGDP
jgi:hypothetical protein